MGLSRKAEANAAREETLLMSADEIAVKTTTVVKPDTGELYDLEVPSEAARAVHDLKALEDRVKDARQAAEYALVTEARTQGRKTLRYGALTVEISGGPGATFIDPVELRAGLVKAECPADRIEEAIKTTVEEKVDRNVTRQLATNEAYKAAIDAATHSFEKRYSVRVG